MRSVLLILFAFLPLLAQADDIVFNASSYKKYQGIPFQIRLLSKENCISTLQQYYGPYVDLKQGLKALAAVDKKKYEEQRTCVDGLLANWDSKFPTKQIEPHYNNEYYSWSDELPEVKIDESKLKEISLRSQCYNPYPPNSANWKWVQDSKKTVCKEWLTKEEKEKLDQQYKEEYQAIDAKRSQLHFQRNIRERLATQLFTTEPPKQPTELTDLQKKVRCFNPYSEGSSDYQYFENSHKNTCETVEKISKEEYKAGQEKIKKAQADFYQIQNEYEVAKSNFSSAFANPKIIEGYNRDSLVSILKEIQCVVPTTNGYDAKYYQSDWKSLCGDKWNNASDLPELKKQLEAAMPGIRDRVAAAIQTKKELEEKRKKEMREASAAHETNYAIRRTLFFHRIYEKNGGDPFAFESFCQDLDQRNKLDETYAKAGMKIDPFSNSRIWKFAEKYNLSESELYAIKDFTDSFYETINPAIWKKQLTDNLRIYKETMERGLQKIPAYNETILTRFATVPKEILAQHKEGAVVCYEAFTSTSKKKNWEWSGDVKFTIRPGPRSKPVFELSSHDGEEEVLIIAGTCFKVTGVSKDEKSKQIHVEMVEVDKAGKIVGKVVPAPASKKKPVADDDN